MNSTVALPPGGGNAYKIWGAIIWGTRKCVAALQFGAEYMFT